MVTAGAGDQDDIMTETNHRNAFVRFLNKAHRSREGKLIAGVCSGLAASSEIPVWVFRALFVTLAFTTIGIIGYLSLWIFMPRKLSHTAGESPSIATA
jgi:phage shock protein PspC (stress-responsive transcriptional regulator)